MSLTVNRDIVLRILNDNEFTEELKTYLNNTIDAEMEKEQAMDDGLVAQCVDALTYIENGETEKAIDCIQSSDKIIRFCHKKNYLKKRFYKGVAAAAILLVLTGAVTVQSSPVLAEQVKDLFTRVVSALSAADEKTFSPDSEVISLYAELPKQINTAIKDESEINLDGITVWAKTADGRDIEIPIENCEITKQYLNDGSEKGILLMVSYGGCSFSIIYTLEG